MEDITWLRTNTVTEALKSIEKLDETLTLVKDDNYQWKWAIIILHNCIQAFMVLTLEGTDQVDVLQDNSKDKKYIRQYLNNKLHYKKYKLDDFMNLYEKIKSKNITQLFCCNKKFNETEAHDAAMVRINDLRNSFVHFFPCRSSLGICEMPETFSLAMEIIEVLIRDMGNFLYRLNKDEISSIKNHIESIDKKLEELEKLYFKI